MSQNIAQHENGVIRSKQDRSPVEKDAPQTTRTLPAMEIEIAHCPMRVEMSYERTEDDVLFRFRYARETSRDSPRINAYMTRETFLEVKTPGEALDFLSLTGHFLSPMERLPKRHESLTWNDFQRWQEMIRLLLRNGPLSLSAVMSGGKNVGVEFAVPDQLRPIMSDLSVEEMGWMSGFPRGIVIGTMPQPPNSDKRNKLFAEILVTSTLEAILATVYVDGLNGVNYGQCKLPECAKLFEITSNHAREYCCTAHAHRAGVRRKRAEAKLKAQTKKQVKGKKA